MPPPADPVSGKMEVIAGWMVNVRLLLAKPTPGRSTATGRMPGTVSLTLQETCMLCDAYDVYEVVNVCTAVQGTSPSITVGVPTMPGVTSISMSTIEPGWPMLGVIWQEQGMEQVQAC